MTADGLVEVSVAGVRWHVESGRFLLVLTDPVRRLPICVGEAEAMAITFALHEVATQRPMTHDALKQTIAALGARLVRIIVGYRADNHTFTADVVLAGADGGERHLDWRTSDAAALAVRCQPRPQILVPESLLADPPPIVKNKEG